MKRSALTLLLLLVACSDGGREVVDGFHGYPWGTRASEIPEIAGTEQVGEKDGLAIYSADVSHLGREVLAGFYFHPRTQGLVEGYYVLPITLEECESEWARYVRDLEQAYPGLERQQKIPVREPADSTRYTSDCEYFVYNAESEEWTATFVNPARPHDRAGLWIKTVGRSLRMTIFYRGGEGQRWESRFRWPALLRREPSLRPPQAPSPEAEGLPFGRA